jgi:hypothetical protein
MALLSMKEDMGGTSPGTSGEPNPNEWKTGGTVIRTKENFRTVYV